MEQLQTEKIFNYNMAQTQIGEMETGKSFYGKVVARQKEDGKLYLVFVKLDDYGFDYLPIGEVDAKTEKLESIKNNLVMSIVPEDVKSMRVYEIIRKNSIKTAEKEGAELYDNQVGSLFENVAMGSTQIAKGNLPIIPDLEEKFKTSEKLNGFFEICKKEDREAIIDEIRGISIAQKNQEDLAEGQIKIKKKVEDIIMIYLQISRSNTDNKDLAEEYKWITEMNLRRVDKEGKEEIQIIPEGEKEQAVQDFMTKAFNKLVEDIEFVYTPEKDRLQDSTKHNTFANSISYPVSNPITSMTEQTERNQGNNSLGTERI